MGYLHRVNYLHRMGYLHKVDHLQPASPANNEPLDPGSRVQRRCAA